MSEWKYRQLIIGGKRILEHRFIMENHISRKLETKEHVHHINGNVRDNRIENLRIILSSQHTRFHHPKKFVELICDFCGKQFKRKRRNRPELTKSKRVYCSRECVYKSQIKPITKCL